jgi:predicted glycogen debranching enzyme
MLRERFTLSSWTDQGQAEQAEWLEADGLGGFASGTVGLVRTRRYHALLLTATMPPAGRVVLVNGVEAWLEGGGGSVPLTSQRYAPDLVHPPAWEHFASFTHSPWPTWVFDLPGGGTLEHEVFVARDAGETVLRWRIVGASQVWRLCVRPLLSGRDYHALHRENKVFDFGAKVAGGNVAWRPYHDLPSISALTNGTYTEGAEWYRNFLYTQERDRGLDAVEDLASPGVFSFNEPVGEPAVMILRAGDGLSVRPAAYAEMLAAEELGRRVAAPKRAGVPNPAGVVASSYLVDRGTGRTVLAGFPWFTDWGRDSFIALRGLAIATGRLREAQAVLLEWAGTVSQGMLPNRFPDDGGAPEYNAVDASLWFIVAVHDFLAATAAPDTQVAQRLGDAVGAILDGYAAGTRFGIAADGDGLIRAGVAGVQLTWMDAKLGDWVVTPRIGKPVEVQALWINALQIGRRWSQRWAPLEAVARASFAERFPAPAGGLYDVIDADHVPGANDASLRPNQIFAVGGLPFPVLEGVAARAVVDVVERHLLTPMGLRTLAPTDPAYVGRYGGSPAQRDGAYHQGTVWPWLLGAFVQAWLRVHGSGPRQIDEAKERFLNPLLAHLETAGLGHVSEVADGDAPHTPGGCPFQAWSVGELIRIQAMLE